MEGPEQLEAPSTPKRQHMTRDERIEAQTLHAASWTYIQIASKLGKTHRQIQTACTSRRTPKKRSGRPPMLSSAQKAELIAFVTATQRNRLLPYKALSSELGWDCSEHAIKRALKAEGFSCYAARVKPALSPQNRAKRLAFARAHVNCSQEEWEDIFWTDETWITGGTHRKRWVTRRKNEELESTCVIEKRPRKAGWMFWGSFSGCHYRGPSLFWEKEWGIIGKVSYCERMVPLIDS